LRQDFGIILECLLNQLIDIEKWLPWLTIRRERRKDEKA